MIRSLSTMYGHKLAAIDGEIGHVKDFYVDDQSWAVRYLVTDTGDWLTGRKVLIAPHHLGSIDLDGQHLPVSLTRRQIEKSPLIETHRPVSRQFEEEYYRHYGLPYYWQGNGLWGMTSFPMIELPAVFPNDGSDINADVGPQPDAHLRSTLAMQGYRITVSDGEFGRISDFMIDDTSWSIPHLVVKTGSWLFGTEVLVDTAHVGRITFEESTVSLDMTREAIRNCPPVAV
jgi:hypothetical protein